MQDFDYTLTWYHGSQQELTKLRVGSSITQNRNVAKAFSHRPSLLTQSGGGTVKHNGVTPGYLYIVADEIGPEDVDPHPHPVNVTRWEWLTNRELKLELIEQTVVTDEERLTDQEIAEMKRKQEERGEQTFAEECV
ncbi:hypothetical protein C6502_08275 [Candidatus Poribacteria bacterium]|nr:MAG: hypothetical protein C6502_08275 [Candidatus Poribacteria bacterium]